MSLLNGALHQRLGGAEVGSADPVKTLIEPVLPRPAAQDDADDEEGDAHTSPSGIR